MWGTPLEHHQEDELAHKTKMIKIKLKKLKNNQIQTF